MLRRLLGPALFAVVTVFSGHARAQDAQSLFDEGLNEMKAQRYKLGCALIKRSLDVEARPGTLFTLAECYSRAGKYASAVAHYDRFLAMFESMTPEQQEQQRARAELSRTERTRLVTSVAWLTVSLPQYSPNNVAITLDGEEFATSLIGIATAVDPGPHVFTVHAPDGPLVEQRVDIAPGERKATVLDVRSAGAPQAPDETEPPATEPADQNNAKPKRAVNPWAYVTGGIGAAGLVTGAISGAMLLDRRSTIKSECPGPPNANGDIVCTAAGKAAADSAQNVLAPVTTVALSLGVAGAVATVLILVLDGNKPPASANVNATASSHPVPLLGFSPHGATVGIQSVW